ncbi:hypothetical protein [Ktedonobacter robiniae]|uniref:Uncharacterized protein n=1 Tax=Ktedonobacter robiniae TaxID=2778365 RepID=A0ABQ3UQG4_9CHLR|nr:hypothetical protein [Ktedonobacter robiniae]GHO54612.1 hypothetical protein KSB_30870 [Ktedonobacter robiniae]
MQQYDRNNLPTTDTLRTKSRSQTVITTALLLFAITGLLSGFTYNAMNRPPKNTPPTTNITKQSPVATKTQTPTSSPTTQPTVNVAAVGLGCPHPTLDQYTLKADGTTTYTTSIQATSKKSGTCEGEALKASGITCKMWLTKDQNYKQTLDSAKDALLKSVIQPMPNEEQNALVFDSNTQQVQPCDNDGKVSWKYKVATSVAPGAYYLIFLTNWQSQRYNWNARAITIQ